MKGRAEHGEGYLKPSPELSVQGFGICGQRFGRQRMIPPVDGCRPVLSLLFNHDPAPAFVDGTEQLLEPMSLSLWDCSKVVDYGAPGLSWRLSWLQVGGSGVEGILSELGLPLNLSRRLRSEQALVRAIEWTADELHLYANPDRGVILNVLRGLLLEFRRAGLSPELRRPLPARLLEAKARVDASFRDGLKLEALAKKAGMSPEHFCRSFKQAFGVPPLEYAMELRMDEVVRGMADPSLGVGELAAQAGFKDMSNFSKTFKRRFGVGPAAYRRRLLSLREGI